MLSNCHKAEPINGVETYLGVEQIGFCSACEDIATFESDIDRITDLIEKIEREIREE